MAQGGGGFGGGGNGGGMGGRGNFDPAQFAKMRLERIKESLEITNDVEWTAIQPLVQKVLDAEAAIPRAMRGGRRGGPEGGSGGGPTGGPGTGSEGGPGSAPGQSVSTSRGGPEGGSGGGPSGAGGGRFGGVTSAEIQALQAAIEAKASPDELKAKLAKVREVRKEKEAALTKAQDDLRKFLTIRQEAGAVLMGLLQ